MIQISDLEKGMAIGMAIGGKLYTEITGISTATVKRIYFICNKSGLAVLQKTNRKLWNKKMIKDKVGNKNLKSLSA
jgi:hypothetical protein